ncbi:MAG: hypothetical protein R3C49_08320 [Planctomycetaceae bacterium]
MFSFRRSLICSLLVAGSVLSPTAFAKIEAVQGKRYPLGPKHGPWMIMVASLQDVPDGQGRKTDGLTAWQAADQIVFELRKLGIPAYAFLQNRELGQLGEFAANTAGTDKRQYIAQHEAIAVLAGNFSQPDDAQAKTILDFLKNRFDPAFLKDQKSGAILPRTPGRPGPFSRAHMTTNPLMPASEIKQRTSDPLVKKLNAGEEYSLLNNKGKYTLRIATFRGNSIVQVGNQVSEKASQHFERFFGSSLDESGERAWELTRALRSAEKLGYEQNYEAWLYHDRFESIVTVGSFDSEHDPRIAEIARRFAAKTREHEGKDVPIAELFTIPRHLKANTPPDKMWVFDARPKLMRVP